MAIRPNYSRSTILTFVVGVVVVDFIGVNVVVAVIVSNVAIVSIVVSGVVVIGAKLSKLK